mgnify:CR=1 FL=1
MNIAYSGGTAFNFVNNTPVPGIKNFQTYIDSQKKMAEKAAAVNATVLLANHSEFDNAYDKNRMLAGGVMARIRTRSARRPCRTTSR